MRVACEDEHLSWRLQLISFVQIYAQKVNYTIYALLFVNQCRSQCQSQVYKVCLLCIYQ